MHGPLARYVKFRVAHAPRMPGTFSPPPRVSDPDIHHDTCGTHVPWCMPGSLTGGFHWSRWWGKRSRHSRRLRNPQFYVSGKRPMLRCIPRCHSVSDICVWLSYLFQRWHLTSEDMSRAILINTLRPRKMAVNLQTEFSVFSSFSWMNVCYFDS